MKKQKRGVHERVEKAVLALYEAGLTRGQIAKTLIIDPQAVDYVRRKFELPATFVGIGRRKTTKCKYGHRMTQPEDYYTVPRPRTGYVERRCKECRREQNAQRNRSGGSSKAELLWMAHHPRRVAE